MDENPGSDAYSKKSGAAETLVQKNQSNSQLERISENTSPPPVAISKTESDFLINRFAIDL